MGRIKNKVPSATADDGETAKKKKVSKKKIRVSRYAIDTLNVASKDLRIKQSCDSEQFPVDLDGEYVTCSRAELINLVYEQARKAYKEARRTERRPDYRALIGDILNKMGCVDYWSRGKIFSELSKNIQARRKVRREAEQRRKIEEARQAELSLGIPEND